MDLISPQLIIMALAVGISSGSIGAFIILKRMALVGDAMSHIALPGIALALFYKIDPFWGVLTFLLIAAVLVWWLENKTRLPTDALVGLLFTSSLAIGVLTIPNGEILESLFGAFQKFSLPLLLFTAGTAAVLTLLIFISARRFLFTVISPELSRIEDGGSNVQSGKQNNLALYLIFAFIVALGIKLVGTLLMGALTIIPAAIAKNISSSMAGYLVLSAALGGIISLGGVAIASRYGFLAGPTIILLGIGIFIISLPFLRK